MRFLGRRVRSRRRRRLGRRRARPWGGVRDDENDVARGDDANDSHEDGGDDEPDEDVHGAYQPKQRRKKKPHATQVPAATPTLPHLPAPLEPVPESRPHTSGYPTNSGIRGKTQTRRRPLRPHPTRPVTCMPSQVRA